MNSHTDKLPKGVVIFGDDFSTVELDSSKWCPVYLPHWTDNEDTTPSYRFTENALRLYISKDQQPWCPSATGQLKVSNLQTGHFSGEVGSPNGQHRFQDGLRVQQYHPPQRLFLPQYCRLEMRAKAKLGKDNLAALWLIGFEDRPERSGEITLMEVFGHNAHADHTVIGHGIKKINDPELDDEFVEKSFPVRMSDWHDYALDWTKDGIRFYLDGEEIFHTTQSPDYPMQLMLNFYDLAGDAPAGDAAWFDIDFVRAFERP